MPMTVANFGQQNQNAGPQDVAGGLDTSDATVQVKDQTVANLKPANSTAKKVISKADFGD